MLQPLLFSALQTILKALIGALNYERVQRLVETLDTTALSGAEKRAAVAAEAHAVGVTVGSALLNLAIEVAVNVLRQRAS